MQVHSSPFSHTRDDIGLSLKGNQIKQEKTSMLNEFH